MLIDSAVKATKGNLKDSKAMAMAMRKADYPSVRGPFKFNNNHHPIQDFYVLKAVKDPKSPEGITMNIEKKVFDDHKDAYHQDCKMKW
jgi:branched-chain amino acid transport system substrate-binding protein